MPAPLPPLPSLYHPGRFYLVTGGTGFIGSALVRRLVKEGCRVRVLDDDSRGQRARLDDLAGRVEFQAGDVRDPVAVKRACQGPQGVIHCAFVNGTEFFYTRPQLVLDVGVRGMLNVLDGCEAAGIRELILASSSEVYQSPPVVPTDESAPMLIPDPLNPRYSYAAGKIISEILALNHAHASAAEQAKLDRMVIFRPHNVFGPAMGFEHVIPQFVLRMKKLAAEQPAGALRFPIQGTGTETRSFIYIDDFIEGLLKVIQRGEHRNIYHIGTMEERSIAQVAQTVGRWFGRDVEVAPGQAGQAQGGTARRCPDIAKLRKLGFEPSVPFEEGLAKTAAWYAK